MNIKVIAGSALMLLVCCSMAVAQWPQKTFGVSPAWEVEAGTRILDRPGTDTGIPLITDNLTRRTLFNSGDATDLNTSAGIDMRVARTSNYNTVWEFRGLYNQWENFQTITGDLRSALLFGVPISNVDYAYDSDFYSLELNCKRALFPGGHAFIGPRFLYLEEVALIDTTVPGAAPLGGDLLVRTTSRTKNPMIGLQIGGEVRRPLIRDVFFLGSVKGGVFANPAEGSVIVQTIDTTPIVPPVLTSLTALDERATHVSGVVELSARLHHDVVPGNISVYVGYEATWLDGVALAPAQVLATATPDLNRLHFASTPFFGGLVVGGTIRY